MKKIGIVGAMAQEVEILVSQMDNPKQTQLAGATFYDGTINGKPVAILQSGIGKVAAAAGTALFLQHCQPDMVINTGSAGGVAQGLKIGDIVISTQTAHHDADVTAFGYCKGQMPGCPPTFPSDEKLATLAQEVALQQDHRVIQGLICSGDSFIHGGQLLSQIKSDFPEVCAVEMEAASIAQVCYMFNLPFVVIRAISDSGDSIADMSFEQFLPLAAKKSSELLLKLIDKIVL
ncbi:MAG: 5'-methylthioadenosine/adenosylhomocysteine nucleosidase [Pasteurellaceae bacterium]|nr:5'-methylthioadenosine/adenosylhomocysteine nucleosidase [Pasteurellaceae bacterium]